MRALLTVVVLVAVTVVPAGILAMIVSRSVFLSCYAHVFTDEGAIFWIIFIVLEICLSCIKLSGFPAIIASLVSRFGSMPVAHWSYVVMCASSSSNMGCKLSISAYASLTISMSSSADLLSYSSGCSRIRSSVNYWCITNCFRQYWYHPWHRHRWYFHHHHRCMMNGATNATRSAGVRRGLRRHDCYDSEDFLFLVHRNI